MIKLVLIPIIAFNYIFSQTEDDIIQIQENSVYWKKGVDKLVLKDGEVFYGEFIETINEDIFFRVELVDEVNIFKISRIRHLVLANGRNIIRNNRDHSLACSFVWLFISIYFSQFHHSIK
tara:strand:+ start:113 stop:472 length:360 start_codon:yes stop_codon:yes gene_type:complete